GPAADDDRVEHGPPTLALPRKGGGNSGADVDDHPLDRARDLEVRAASELSGVLDDSIHSGVVVEGVVVEEDQPAGAGPDPQPNRVVRRRVAEVRLRSELLDGVLG